MKRISLLMVLMLVLGFTATATADEPKGDKQHVAAQALETFTGSWEIVKV